jgi:hypothetical protein
MGIISYLFALAQDMALAAIPAVGFAMVFNVPQRALRWCALLGAIGHGSRMVMMRPGLILNGRRFSPLCWLAASAFNGPAGIWRIPKFSPSRP